MPPELLDSLGPPDPLDPLEPVDPLDAPELPEPPCEPEDDVPEPGVPGLIPPEPPPSVDADPQARRTTGAATSVATATQLCHPIESNLPRRARRA
jgi:hypothetical protein